MTPAWRLKPATFAQTSRHYREKTATEYAEAFRKQLKKKLNDSGWDVIDIPEESAMTIKATLFDLNINAPDIGVISHPLVLYIGSSSFELSILDANNQLALFISHNGTASSISSSFVETDNAMNFSRFNKLFNGWANNFAVYLNIVSEL
jgi:hypothetical protein